MRAGNVGGSVQIVKRRGRPPALHQFVNGVEGKVCTGCKVWHTLDDFPSKSTVASGRTSRCKSCASNAGRSWRLKCKASPRPRSPELLALTEKRCPACDQILPRSAFPVNRGRPDGMHAYCLACNRRLQRASRDGRREQHRDMLRRYRATEKGRAAHAKYKPTHPWQHWAQKKVWVAINAGRLTKSDACSKCGTAEGRIDGHHDDYAKPLDVRWLCRWCHQEWHRINGEAANANASVIV